MSRKPDNWYNMTWEEQRDWKRAESERENLEYDLDRARQEMQNASYAHRQELQRQQHEAFLEYSDLSQENEELRIEIEHLKSLLKDFINYVKETGNLDIAPSFVQEAIDTYFPEPPERPDPDEGGRV